MKKRAFTILFSLIFLSSFAQVKLSPDFKTTAGTPYKVVDGGSKEYFSDGKGQVLSVKTQGEKVTILKFDVNTMKETGRKVYEDFPPINKIQKVLPLGDKIFYIFSSFNKKAKKEDLYVREVNMAQGTFMEPKLLFSTGSEVTVSYYQDAMSLTMFGLGIPIRFEVLPSFDNSKILIRYRTKPLSKKDAINFDILGFYVFDAQFNKIWGSEIKMPYTEADMNNLVLS